MDGDLTKNSEEMLHGLAEEKRTYFLAGGDMAVIWQLMAIPGTHLSERNFAAMFM